MNPWLTHRLAKSSPYWRLPRSPPAQILNCLFHSIQLPFRARLIAHSSLAVVMSWLGQIPSAKVGASALRRCLVDPWVLRRARLYSIVRPPRQASVSFDSSCYVATPFMTEDPAHEVARLRACGPEAGTWATPTSECMNQSNGCPFRGGIPLYSTPSSRRLGYRALPAICEK